jgi:RND family efflux transporter MFP subunit
LRDKPLRFRPSFHTSLHGLIVNPSGPDLPRAAHTRSNFVACRFSRLLAARRSAAVFAMCGAALALAACHQRAAVDPAPRPVVAVALHPDGRTVEASLPGEVEARYTTPLSFRVAGKIVERDVRLGYSVKTGQIVARLDPADAQKNVSKAQAQLDAAQHRLIYAKQQLERDSAQAGENLIAPAQLEQTQDAYAAAAAQRDSAQAQLALARDQLQYTTLTADHAGVITAELAETGQNVAVGQGVYTLAWSGDVDIVCDAPEQTLPALAVGRAAHVTLTALPGKQLVARVREVSPAADPQSRTYRVKLTLEAPDSSVRLGMTADVAFAAANEALAVLLGRTPDAAPEPIDLASLSLPEEVPVVVPSELLQARPDIRAADAALKAAAADVGVATAQLFPSLSLTASLGHGGFNWPAALSGAGTLWSIGGALSQPLFHGGALLAQRRASIDNYDAAALQYKAAVLSAFQNVADTLAALEHDAQTLDAADTAARAAQVAFDETTARGRLGAVPVSAVRVSEQQYLNARLDAIRATGQRLSDTAMLFQAMGELPVEVNP